MGAAAIAAGWLLALPVVLLLGSVPAAVSRARGPQLLRAALWTGLAVLTVVVTLTNLWLPLRSWSAVLVVAVVAVVSGLLTARRIRSRITRGWQSPGVVIPLLAAVGALLLAVGSSLTPTHYDFGLYHYSMVRFAAEFPAIPGIANVLSYFGYANPEFPLAAFMTNGPAGLDGYRSLNGLWAVALVFDLVLRMASRRQRAGSWVSPIGVVVVLVPTLALADWMLASPTSDTAVFILCLASTAALADIASAGRVSPTSLLTSLAPLLIASAMRPQMSIVLLATASVVGIMWWRDGAGRGARWAAVSLAVLGVGFAAAIASRDYVLTGRLLFPLSVVTFDVPWLADDPATLRSITIGIARDPGPGYQQAAHGWSWLPGWVARQPTQWEFWLFLLLALGGIGALALAHRRRPLQWRRLLLLLAPSVLFMLAWVLVLPPTWRLAVGPAFSIGAVGIGWGLSRLADDPRRLARACLIVAVIVGSASALLRYPGKPDTFPTVTTRQLPVAPGLTLLVPQGTDQCWDSGLLCTSVPDTRLRPLGQTLEDGFRIER